MGRTALRYRRRPAGGSFRVLRHPFPPGAAPGARPADCRPGRASPRLGCGRARALPRAGLGGDCAERLRAADAARSGVVANAIRGGRGRAPRERVSAARSWRRAAGGSLDLAGRNRSRAPRVEATGRGDRALGAGDHDPAADRSGARSPVHGESAARVRAVHGRRARAARRRQRRLLGALALDAGQRPSAAALLLLGGVTVAAAIGLLAGPAVRLRVAARATRQEPGRAYPLPAGAAARRGDDRGRARPVRAPAAARRRSGHGRPASFFIAPVGRRPAGAAHRHPRLSHRGALGVHADPERGAGALAPARIRPGAPGANRPSLDRSVRRHRGAGPVARVDAAGSAGSSCPPSRARLPPWPHGASSCGTATPPSPRASWRCSWRFWFPPCSSTRRSTTSRSRRCVRSSRRGTPSRRRSTQRRCRNG